MGENEKVMTEEWRSVVGFGEGFYEVSNLGRYRSLDRIVSNNWGNGPRLMKGRVMKLHKRGNYWFASITVDGKMKNIYIHRLVARAFPEICGEWFEKYEVDHLDCDINNNTAWNLKVCNRKENMNNPNTRKTRTLCKSKWVIKLNFNDEILHFYQSSVIAARENHLCASGIRACCYGKQQTCGGYKWKYAE